MFLNGNKIVTGSYSINFKNKSNFLLIILILTLIFLSTSSLVAAADNSHSIKKNLSSTNQKITSTTQIKSSSTTTLPKKYDLRTKGKLTKVKNQGPLGTCWIFATYGSLESCLLPGQSMNFSENNMKNLCSYLYPEGFERNWTYLASKKFNGGGNCFTAMAYLTRYSGPVNATSDPYNTKSGYSPSGLTPMKLIQETVIIPARNDPLDNDQIKTAIMRYGAVSSTMRTGSGKIFAEYYNEKYASYYYPGSRDPRKNLLDHAICIVGWDDNYSKNKFKIKPPGNGAFIVRNSWGSDWGDGGYFYISYYDRVLGKDYNVVFNNAVSTTTYKSQYSYDPYGVVSNIQTTETYWFSNVFTAQNNDKLAAVSFYNLNKNSVYEISVYLNPKKGKPNSGTLAAKVKGILSTMGYKTIKLSNLVSITKDQKFSVVVKLTTPGKKTILTLEIPLAKYSSRATAKTGQSYVSDNGIAWDDLTKISKNSNVCLKAFTV